MNFSDLDFTTCINILTKFTGKKKEKKRLIADKVVVMITLDSISLSPMRTLEEKRMQKCKK